MKVAFVSSEVTPFSKTGGLADVAGSLPKELKSMGNDVIVFTPKYSTIDKTKFKLRKDKKIGELNISIGDQTYTAKIFTAKLPGSAVKVHFVDSPHFFSRDSFYTNDSDEDERFIFFSKAVIETLKKLNWHPNIIHCNDWHTGLIPALIKENYRYDDAFKYTSFVFTIHNLAFQGTFPKESLTKSGLSEDLFFPMGPFEFYGKMNFLKAGISYSEVINTVSETYAKEILTKEFGAGLDDVLLERHEDIHGIVNGVDYSEWNPAVDDKIPFNYSVGQFSIKEKNKKHLLKQIGLSYKKEIPLIGFVGRLTEQKGFDIIAGAMDKLMGLDAQWIFLGNGEEEYEDLLNDVIAKFPDKVKAIIGFDNDLAHLIEAGSDMFLMPSRFEPCGLNQLYSLKYGTVPIVRKTGGLANTVSDWIDLVANDNHSGTGFVFEGYSSNALVEKISDAITLFGDKKIWKQIQKNGMKQDYSWRVSAEKYVELYNIALKNSNTFRTK